MAAYIQFTSRLKSTTQDGILAEAQQIAVSPTDNTNLKTYIDNKVSAGVSAAYRPKGSVTFAGLSALTSASVGDVYNVTDSFTLNGKKYAAGSNVACLKAFSAKVTPDETYWDVLGGFIDLSPYALASDLTKAKTDLEGSISNTNANLARLASNLDERVPNEIRLLDGGDYYQISGQDEAHPAKIGKDTVIGDKISITSNSNGLIQLTHDSKNIVAFGGEKSVNIGGTGNNAGNITLMGTILASGNIGIAGTLKATGLNTLNGVYADKCIIGTGVSVKFKDNVVSDDTFEHSLLFNRIDTSSGRSDDYFKFVRYGSGIQIKSGDEYIHIDNKSGISLGNGYALRVVIGTAEHESTIGTNARIYANTSLGTSTNIYYGVRIGSNTDISENSVVVGSIYGASIGYPYSESDTHFCQIGSNVTIEDNVHIEGGVTISQNHKSLEFNSNPAIVFNNTMSLMVDDNKIAFGTANTYYTFGRFVNGGEVTPLFSGKVVSGNVAGDDTVYIGKSLIDVGSNAASPNGVWIGKHVSIGNYAMIAENSRICTCSEIGLFGGKDAVTSLGSDLGGHVGLLIGAGISLTSESSGELWFGTDPTKAEGRKKVAFADDVASAKSDVTELAKRVSALEALMTVAS